MSNGLQEDIKNTIKKMKNPTGMMESENWLRHTGEDATICDEMLLIGATKDQIAKAMLDRGLKPTIKKALQRVQRHFKHLKAAGKSESQTGHNLPLIEDSNGKWRFDLKKLEAMHNGITHPVSNSLAQGAIPTEEEIKAIYREIAKPGEEKPENLLKEAVEKKFARQGRKLRANWWEITKRNLIEWSKKG